MQRTWGALTILVVGLTLWSARWTLVYQFDAQYLNDYFDHSQWRIPLSDRVISDGELYQISGWRLFHGADTFDIAPEVPPVAKYVYGASLAAFNNPFMASLMVYALVLVLSGRLLWQLDKKESTVILGLLLLALLPILITLLTATPADGIQLVFLLGTVSAALSAKRATRINWQLAFACLAGMLLGAFSATKFPALTPVVGLVTAWFWWRNGRAWLVLPFAFWTGAIFSLAFLPTLIKFGPFYLLSSLKWMINFYLDGDTPFVWGMPVITVVSGFFKGWWEHATFRPTPDWSVLWPTAVVFAGAQLYQARQQLQRRHSPADQTYVLVLAFALFASYLLIPFWPRFMTLVLPLWLIGSVGALKATRLLPIILLAAALQWFCYLHPQPSIVLHQLEVDMGEERFYEVYSFLSESELELSRGDFAHKLQLQYRPMEADITEFTITHPFVWPWQRQIEASVSMRVRLPIGEWQTNTPVLLIKHNHQWRLVWDWAILAPGFSPADDLRLTLNPAEPGTIRSADQFPLSSPQKLPYVVFIRTPESTEPSAELAELLSVMTGVNQVERESLLNITYRGLSEVPFGYVRQPFTDVQIQQLETFSNIKLEKRPGLQPHPAILDLSKIEFLLGAAAQDSSLHGQPGGKLEVVRADGSITTLMEVEPIAGQDLILKTPTAADFYPPLAKMKIN